MIVSLNVHNGFKSGFIENWLIYFNVHLRSDLNK